MSNSKKDILDDLKNSDNPAERMKWLIEKKEELKTLREIWRDKSLLEKPIHWTPEQVKWWNDMFDKYAPEFKPDDGFWKEPQVKGVDCTRMKRIIEAKAKKIKDELEEYELYPQLKPKRVTSQPELLDIKKEK